MRVPISWLKDFVSITVSVEELAQRLTFAGLEVERIEYIGIPPQKSSMPHRSEEAEGSGGLAWDRDKIFVGQILEVKPHPNADRLTLALVDYGHGPPIQVVTGAPNIRVGEHGQKVAFALEGSRLYDGHTPGRVPMTLKKSKIRGVESSSMVCSEKELGLSEEHEGILILPPEAPVGTPLADYMGDVVLDIKINPNMARAQSIQGVAREVAALTGQQLRDPGEFAQVVPSGAVTEFVGIEISDKSLSARYSAALINRVRISPSPFRMRRRLELAGMRSINNIVDITNYVMIELGQPLHAFDYDKLKSRAKGQRPTIRVRPARQGEQLETLDRTKRDLKPTDLLITDSVGPIALGGVMGGADSEVSENTENILLESANFDYISVRRTTKEHGLPSEAATRFGRGISPVQTIPALQRAGALMQELAEGQVAPAIADNYAAPVAAPEIILSNQEVARLLGLELETSEIARILKSLDFAVESAENETLVVAPPDYRLDVDGTDDVIEEIVRIYGYDRIPSTLIADELPPQRTNEELEGEEAARNLLVNLGLQEVVTYALTNPAREAILTPPNASVSPSDLGKRSTQNGRPFDPRPARPYVEIENPISIERSVMRQSLLPSVMEILASNLRFSNRAALFEIGRVYLKRDPDGPETDGENPEDRAAGLPREERRLAVAITGPREVPSWQRTDSPPLGFFDLKGILEEFAAGLHLSDISYEASPNPMFHPGRGAAITLGDRQVGVFGELHPVVLEQLDLNPPVGGGEFDLEAILSRMPAGFLVKPLSRYPAIIQDIALMVDERIPAARVEQLIRQTGGALVVQVWLFDVFIGESMPAGKKSLAYRLSFQAPDRGLTDGDAAKIREKIVQRLHKELGAELRSG